MTNLPTRGMLAGSMKNFGPEHAHVAEQFAVELADALAQLGSGRVDGCSVASDV